MTKQLFLSLAVITLTLAGVAGATVAYFSSGTVLSGNTFKTGNVGLGEFNYSKLDVVGLIPGTPVVIPNFAVNYIGDIKADLYAGARGTSKPGDAAYIADHLYLRIYYQGTSAVVWEGVVSELSTAWQKIATNTSAGWQAYDLQFTLDSDTPNEHQGITNSDTEILIYAVQTGGSVPSTAPYQTTGTPPWTI